jgi:hypothetical protein
MEEISGVDRNALAERLNMVAPWARHEVLGLVELKDVPPRSRQLIGRPRRSVTRTKRKSKREKVWERDKGICQLCAQAVPLKRMTLDRVIPGAKGGKYTEENCQTACGPCNNRKGDKVVPRFAYARPAALRKMGITAEEHAALVRWRAGK